MNGAWRNLSYQLGLSVISQLILDEKHYYYYYSFEIFPQNTFTTQLTITIFYQFSATGKNAEPHPV